MTAEAHFLDVGRDEYGDAVLCEFGAISVLIDGAHPGDQLGSPGHPSIPDQLRSLLEQRDGPVTVNLLVVTHAHQDHIGCLPWLVENDILRPEWALVADPGLGWGRPAGADVAPVSPDSRVVHLVAGLREEVRSERTGDATLAQFLVDAANLEQRYTQMLERLERRGTHVVRYGRDDPAALLRAFRRIGLRIFGPSQAQLLLCAEAIARTTTDAVAAASGLLDRADAPAVPTDVYRALVSDRLDALDASRRPGPAINLQSIVTRFNSRGAKLLFGGDMQFADPQIGDERLREELRSLRRAIERDAPFDVVKISHHGSDNAFSEETLRELKATPLFGICAGSNSLAHPNPDVLRLLSQSRERLSWIRTDRNGLSSVRVIDDRSEIDLTKGNINDPRPNRREDVAEAPERAGTPVSVETKAREGERVEIVTTLPDSGRRVKVTVAVEGDGDSWSRGAVLDRPLRIAGGRELPPLLFVTSRDALMANVGEAEASSALAAIRDAGLLLVDDLPVGDVQLALGTVRGALQRNSEIEGVVILGGYDVVPARRLDVLPPRLRTQLGVTSDPDDFVVWSDDAYGDREDDLIPELPVTRIPDGRAADLLFAQLRADDASRPAPRRGVRNVARPFAEEIFRHVPGDEGLFISKPTTYDFVPPPQLDADLVYLMLHGDFLDASRFWGEETVDNREAVNLTNIPGTGARVVFAGCCWGALIVDQPAIRTPRAPAAPRTLSASLALSFLQAGALAFVGCTGAHYSPTEEPFGYFGGPMHEAFWRHLAQGSPPAHALFRAKVEYVAGFPHGRTTPLQEAIEFKILRQYTCLGLGW